jgi:ATP-binding cassette subfamily C (CFTR/MRP) protein 4
VGLPPFAQMTRLSSFGKSSRQCTILTQGPFSYSSPVLDGLAFAWTPSCLYFSRFRVSWRCLFKIKVRPSHLDRECMDVLILQCFAFVVVGIIKGWFVVDPAILGLALTLLLQLAGTFQWAVRQSAELTNQMVSVERVSEYSKLTPEAPLSTDADAAAPDWPSKGAIDCHDLSIRYRSSLPPALTGATFRIEGGERVGCVGRTGAGKSSLVQALLRILEAEKGQIEIDGIDISSLGLHKLRHQVAVIPQTPVLFSGSTIMENIDPFGTFDEQAVRKALRDVQMLDAVDSLPQGLNSVVAEGGSNFSVGQRQLLCLARAILRRTKILILDEPSANVDKQTDQLLQEAVSANFPDSTIIAVAHRLDTVIAYDKIVVLGGGRILEFGAPKALIEAEGDFAKMVEDTGSRTAQELRRRSGVITPIK